MKLELTALHSVGCESCITGKRVLAGTINGWRPRMETGDSSGLKDTRVLIGFRV